MYEIVIREKKTVRENRKGDWVAVSKAADGSVVYGYAPDNEKDIEINTELYSQIVEHVDLVAVINAVNKNGA